MKRMGGPRLYIMLDQGSNASMVKLVNQTGVALHAIIEDSVIRCSRSGIGDRGSGIEDSSYSTEDTPQF